MNSYEIRFIDKITYKQKLFNINANSSTEATECLRKLLGDNKFKNIHIIKITEYIMEATT